MVFSARNTMAVFLLAIVALITVAGVFIRSSEASSGALAADVRYRIDNPTVKDTMKIKMTLADQTLIATLEESPSARDFFSMLPLTLLLEDYAGTEKIAYLPRKLTTQGAPKGIDPDVGYLTYYAPWGNLAIFYRDFGYSTGLIKLGRIESGMAHLTAHPSATVTVEAVK
ncbi:cyclophilin-like fold protein [Dickeya chrysanthemi]|uniref:cyclophilin-like fold protein n=1 Tax=Dickeya chrysanthemi TaxID=556 RepID=UPI0003A2B112|nr:cyclophilin-like fold protein [Dickeya chrysanthemi]